MIRYEHKAPGEMIPLDFKKLGKIYGVGHRIHTRAYENSGETSERLGPWLDCYNQQRPHAALD